MLIKMVTALAEVQLATRMCLILQCPKLNTIQIHDLIGNYLLKN